MQYRKDRYGNDISILGYGCMRFTKKGTNIDLAKADREIMEAYRRGVNYFDTAYIYPGSEVALGKIVAKNRIREKIRIATKLPQYMIVNRDKLDKFFEEQLTRLQTDYVDYYLMHHMTDMAMWEKLHDMGIEQWIAEKKASGAIRNIGFSYHGNTENFLKILDAYDWDFCQIQYNYLDEVSQAGRKGLMAAAAKGIPVIIMEPLRGGKLVNMLPEPAKRLIAKYGEGRTPAELAFRWLYDQPEVTCVLSGMNSMEMVEENCRVASEAGAGCLTKREKKVIEKVKEIIKSREKVGCTGCRYCMPCPKGVDIPGIFRCYNTMYSENKHNGRWEFAQTVSLTKDPCFADQCIECGKCELHCPQSLPIREKLKEADKALRPFYYRIGINIGRKYMLRKAKKKKI